MRADFNEAHVAAAGLLARLCCWMHPLEQQPQEGSGGVGAGHSTGGGIAAAQDASCAADKKGCGGMDAGAAGAPHGGSAGAAGR